MVWQRLLCTKGAWGFLQSAGAGGGEGPSEPKLRRGGEKLHLQCTRGEVLGLLAIYATLFSGFEDP